MYRTKELMHIKLINSGKHMHGTIFTEKTVIVS